MGWLGDDVLDGLYRAATCFVFPSLAEGFGLPVLDALVRGTPVACSNATSLPEVAGDATLYFEPTDTGAIAAAIDRLLQDSALRDRLRAAGPVQARKFSWRQNGRGDARQLRACAHDCALIGLERPIRGALPREGRSVRPACVRPRAIPESR